MSNLSSASIIGTRLASRILLLAVLLWARSGHAQYAALVTVDPVVKQAFTQTIPITGRLVSKQVGTITTRIEGTVATMHVQVGDAVVHNQLLATLDTATLELQEELASAKLNATKAQLALAEQAAKRLSDLTNSAAISQATYDDAIHRHNIALAQTQEAIATLELAELELAYAEVRAPFAGTVTDRVTESGSYLRRGDAVVRLISEQQLEAEADIPYNYLGGLYVGNQVEMRLDNGSSHTATVRAVLPEQDLATRTQRVRFVVRFADEAGSLAAKQSISVLIPLSGERDIVSVHKDAVIRRGQDNIVFVVTDETANSRIIRLGESSGGRIEVLDGLKPGDLVVVRGNERLQPNQKVVLSNPQ